MELTPDVDYALLLKQISDSFRHGQAQAARAVNAVLTDTYWQVRRHIVEFEQAGQARAAYGKALLEELARDLSLRHGRGFSRSNLSHMRQFFLRYPIREKASHKLSWSHYVELLKLDDDLERGFYEQQAIAEGWSVPELKRQKNSQLFLRLAASKDKAGILQLARQGQLVEQPNDLLREPYAWARGHVGTGSSLARTHRSDLSVSFATKQNLGRQCDTPLVRSIVAMQDLTPGPTGPTRFLDQ